MPTFDFQCQKCKTVFEFARPFGSKATPACPSCKNKKTEKLLTPPAVQFKGSGFYKTDSSKPTPAAKPAEAKAPAPDKPATESPKPAPKTPEKGV